MERDFWQQSWTNRQIGFHLPAANPLLVAHAGFFEGAARVYVPLCGKTLDLVYLRERHHEVVGCEFVPQAVAEFFEELRVTPDAELRPPFRAHSCDGLTLLEGDAFAITAAHTGGPIDAIYDRASLVAIAPAERERLVATYRGLLPRGGRILLVTFDYEQAKAPGPPWSIDPTEVERLFGSWCSIRELASHVAMPGPSLTAAGVLSVTERVFALTVV